MASLFKCSPKYVCNSVTFVLLLVYFIALRVASFVGSPTSRGFYCNDRSILYPPSKETVPTWALVILIISLPLIAIIIGSVITTIRNNHYAVDSPKTFLFTHVLPPTIQYVWYIFTLGLLVATVDVVKLYTGELRPNFIQTCDPDFSTLNCTTSHAQGLLPVFITQYNCRGDSNDVRQSRLSFPSGHAAYSTFAGVFTALYISTIPLTKPRSPSQLLLMVMVLLVSVVVSVSRIVDHKHHPHDVIIGMLIGATLAAILVFYNLRYFQRSSRASEIRIKDDAEVQVHNNKGDGATATLDDIIADSDY